MANFLSNGATIMIAVLLVLAIAYRYYSAFIAAKVLALDDARPTPAHTLNDGQNYHPTNKWVLFGHHFAAISGAGPLIGPVLAAQFGYLPGLLWILIGVCLAGAVQDFVILAFSTRRNGKSLAQIAYSEIGPMAGAAATIGILFVLVIALAGLGKVVTKALGGEVVKYAAGTEFIILPGQGAPAATLSAPETTAALLAGEATQPAGGITVKDFSAKSKRYAVPKGARIAFPNNATQVLTSPIELTATMADGSDVPDLLVADGQQVRGTLLRVPAGASASQRIPGSSWGTFTIAATIPIALFIGLYMYRIRKGRVVEASIIGGLLTLVAVYLGGLVADPTSSWHSLAPHFDLSESKIGLSMVIYGFVASILPVWILLCPRDYLSSFLKIGTVAGLVIGVLLARPHLHAPAINTTFLGGGPVVPGAIFPFVFITIMCGAVSGFHALVSSGTTPKMIDKETHARTIGYGAMLIEGLVGIVALIAASALPVQHYYDINTPTAKVPEYQASIMEVAKNDRMATIGEPLPDVGEHLQGRTGGAVTLAIGMAEIFNDAIANVTGLTAKTASWMNGLFSYWYHFAIMFEALFILTTIDTGTRVGRFLLQETMGKWVHPKLGKNDWWPSAVVSTLLISLGWWYFLDAFNGFWEILGMKNPVPPSSFAAIWEMFGIANQMLAVMALAIASAVLAGMGKKKYLAVTMVPMGVVAITTTWAAVMKLIEYYGKMKVGPDGKWAEGAFNAAVSMGCTLAILTCAGIVIIGAIARAGMRPVNKLELTAVR